MGGTPDFWRRMLRRRSPRFQVTILNNESQPPEPEPWLRLMIGDARALPFHDDAFDVVFSNSVIEHVGDAEDQAAMAREVQRVGRCYFVQTPNYYFPIEPHCLFPGFQFLPLAARVFVLTHVHLPRANSRWATTFPTRDVARAYAAGITLMSAADLRRTFPGAALYRERILGVTKSLIVYGGESWA